MSWLWLFAFDFIVLGCKSSFLFVRYGLWFTVVKLALYTSLCFLVREMW